MGTPAFRAGILAHPARNALTANAGKYARSRPGRRRAESSCERARAFAGEGHFRPDAKSVILKDDLLPRRILPASIMSGRTGRIRGLLKKSPEGAR